MMDNNLVLQFLTQINDAIDYKLSGLSQIKSAIIHSVNQNGTVNLYIPPNRTVYHNIQNQSIYRNLQPGDNVKIIVENGSLSSMWVIGGFQLDVQDAPRVVNQVDVDIIYPIGSIYMAVNQSDPAILFGGQWEQIKGMLSLNVEDTSSGSGLTVYMWKRIG